MAPTSQPPADLPGASAARRRRGSINRDTIIAAALDVIDERGVEGLTMRTLATALSINPMTTYTYFDNKADLLDAVLIHEAARLVDYRGPAPADDPDAGLEHTVSLALHYWDVLHAHPNLAPTLAERSLLPIDATRRLVAGIDLLRHAGFTDERLPLAADAVLSVTFGFIVHDALQHHHRVQLDEPYEVQQRRVLRELQESDDDTTVAEALVQRRLTPGAERETFEHSIRALLRGLRDGLGEPPRS